MITNSDFAVSLPLLGLNSMQEVTKNKIVSIILPVFNGEEFISTAIESVLHQMYTAWELLIIDDGSTDGTAERVRQHSDSRIIYIKNEQNTGIQKSLNSGLQNAKGEYVARIDVDDVWSDVHKLALQVDFLETHKQYVLIGTGAIVVNEKGAEQFRYVERSTDQEIRNRILFHNPFIHSSVLMRKDALVSVGGYSEDKSVLHVEDYDLWFRLSGAGQYANLPKHCVLFMVRETSLSSMHKVDQFRKNIQLIKKYGHLFKYRHGALLWAHIRLCLIIVMSATPVLRSLRPVVFQFYKRWMQ